MLMAGTTQRKLKATGLQDGQSGQLLLNETNYYLPNKTAHN